ncbi:MAG: AsnC family transcriptional regulator, partial [Rhodospirillales bacterium]|nr:AsnC family transcriptional regulator [Rhodospirillales bacterium]
MARIVRRILGPKCTQHACQGSSAQWHCAPRHAMLRRMLDAFDRRILGLLQEDADLPLQEVADRVGLSASACSRRIMRMRQDGTIARRI